MRLIVYVAALLSFGVTPALDTAPGAATNVASSVAGVARVRPELARALAGPEVADSRRQPGGLPVEDAAVEDGSVVNEGERRGPPVVVGDDDVAGVEV